MRFRDRGHAAELLVGKLRAMGLEHPLVLAIPRGAVPMARVIAEALDGDLDVVLVRKIGAPGQPELAIGSVSEDGGVRMNSIARALGVTRDYVESEATRQLEVIRSRRRALAGHPAVCASRRTVVLVDDGIATGSTMEAAIASVRAAGPARIVVAAGAAPPSTIARLRTSADEVVCLVAPASFRAVGEWFDDFSPVTDDEVVETLRQHREGTGRRRVAVRAAGADLDAVLDLPQGARGLVVFAHGSGSSRHSPRNRFVADVLRSRGLGTLLLDLLTADEDRDPGRRFDIDLLTRRVEGAVRWAAARPATRSLPIGLFGASTGAACALRAAAAQPGRVTAVVSRGGRPDLAGEALADVRCPVLLIVGGDDVPVLALNRDALARLGSPDARLEVVPGATHLFEEPGTLDRAARVAADWFERHLAPHAAGAAAP